MKNYLFAFDWRIKLIFNWSTTWYKLYLNVDQNEDVLKFVIFFSCNLSASAVAKYFNTKHTLRRVGTDYLYIDT